MGRDDWTLPSRWRVASGRFEDFEGGLRNPSLLGCRVTRVPERLAQIQDWATRFCRAKFAPQRKGIACSATRGCKRFGADLDRNRRRRAFILGIAYFGGAMTALRAIAAVLIVCGLIMMKLSTPG